MIQPNTPKLKIYTAAIHIYAAVSIVIVREHLSIFVVLHSLNFCLILMACILPVYRRIGKAELRHYMDLERLGVPIPAEITFSAFSTKQDGMFRAEGELRYKITESGLIKDIVKPSTITRSYKPEANAVESVEVIILPGYPKSGVERSHAKNEIERIEKELFMRRWYLIVSLLLAIAMWPWERSLTLWLAPLTLFAAFVWFAAAKYINTVREDILDPTDDVTVTKVRYHGCNVALLSHSTGPDLRPVLSDWRAQSTGGARELSQFMEHLSREQSYMLQNIFYNNHDMISFSSSWCTVLITVLASYGKPSYSSFRFVPYRSSSGQTLAFVFHITPIGLACYLRCSPRHTVYMHHHLHLNQ